MSTPSITRRHAIGSLAALVGGAAAAGAQAPASSPATGRGAGPGRIPPRPELVNVPEFGEVAKLKLSGPVFATIAPEDRQAIDLITLRPRLFVNTMALDLAVTLFGASMPLPMLIGPAPDQKRFHPEGELATVKGAAGQKVTTIVSSRASVPVDQVAAAARSPLWYHVTFDEANVAARAQQAVQAGCKVVCVGAPATGGARRIDWSAVDQIRQKIQVPLVLAGVSTPEDAKAALDHRMDGIIVSKRRDVPETVKTEAMAILPGIADAIGGKVPVLLEDSYERGQDIFKALSLGAQAVVVTRPAMWGLAAYGAEGVEAVFTQLMTELAKTMSACGKVNVSTLDRTAVKVHAGVPKVIS